MMTTFATHICSTMGRWVIKCNITAELRYTELLRIWLLYVGSDNWLIGTRHLTEQSVNTLTEIIMNTDLLHHQLYSNGLMQKRRIGVNSWCSRSIACRRCSNYIFILDLTPGFDILHKDNCKMTREAFKFGIWCVWYYRSDGTSLLHWAVGIIDDLQKNTL